MPSFTNLSFCIQFEAIDLTNQMRNTWIFRIYSFEANKRNTKFKIIPVFYQSFNENMLNSLQPCCQAQPQPQLQRNHPPPTHQE